MAAPVQDRLEELLGRADAALYRGKAQGRNQVQEHLGDSPSARITQLPHGLQGAGGSKGTSLAGEVFDEYVADPVAKFFKDSAAKARAE